MKNIKSIWLTSHDRVDAVNISIEHTDSDGPNMVQVVDVKFPESRPEKRVLMLGLLFPEDLKLLRDEIDEYLVKKDITPYERAKVRRRAKKSKSTLRKRK